MIFWNKFKKHVVSIKDENGATAIEYGLIAALISIACIIALKSIGLNLLQVFQTISNALSR